MKKTLSVIGALALVLIVFAVGFIVYGAYQGHELDESSKKYVDENVPVIVSNWSKSELLKRASPRLASKLEEDPVRAEQLFVLFSKLGGMQSYGPSKGDSFVSYINTTKTVTAVYLIDAKFSNGDAKISVRLSRETGQWMINYFNVDSPVFLNVVAPKSSD